MTRAAPDAGRERRLLAVLLAPMFMYQADATIVNVANPAIGADLHATAAELELVIGGYLLGSATMFIAGARLGQIRGYRRMFLLGLALFGVASLLCGLAPSPAALIATRVAQGAGGALMIPLALYLQQGLGHSPLISGLTLVSWVVAFGVPGRLLGRVPDRRRAIVAPAGCALLALAYLAISAAMLTGHHAEGLLVVLLGIGGFGLGTNFSALLEHLTSATPPEHAADISGALATSTQIAGTIGVAVFGTAYLGLLHGPGPAHATHAFGLITATFAIATLVAAIAAYRATHIGRRYA